QRTTGYRGKCKHLPVGRPTRIKLTRRLREQACRRAALGRHDIHLPCSRQVSPHPAVTRDEGYPFSVRRPRRHENNLRTKCQLLPIAPVSVRARELAIYIRSVGHPFSIFRESQSGGGELRKKRNKLVLLAVKTQQFVSGLYPYRKELLPIQADHG